MPLQNRVLPTGEIVADPARGLMMGSRGCLHGPSRELGVSRWPPGTGRTGLLLGGRLRPWSLAGYGAPDGAGVSGPVEVLTPPAIIAVIAAGYRPLVHPTARPERPPMGTPPPGVRV